MTIKRFRSHIQLFLKEEKYGFYMPKGFSDEEKEIIKNQLIKTATEMFGIYGLQKTNVEEITDAVGIAKGSFYSFYNSKEELFLDVLKQTETVLIKEMGTILKTFKLDPKAKFRELINFHIKMPKEHPIIHQVSDKKTRTLLIRKLQGNDKLNQALDTYDYLPMFIKEWQKKGYIIDEDPEIVAGVLKSIFTIGLDDEIIAYIGKDKFPKIIDTLLKIIVDYFVVEHPHNQVKK